MARPQSQTVKYFPHMANASQKKTVFALESRFGVAGYSAWFKTLELLASTEGHFLDLNDEAAWLHCCAFLKMTEEDALIFYDMCSRLGCICGRHWGEKIVFSQSFVDGIVDAYRKRKCSPPDAPLKEFPAEETGLTAEETPLLEDNRRKSGGRNPQIRLYKTRLDKTKEDHPPLTPPPGGDHQHQKTDVSKVIDLIHHNLPVAIVTPAMHRTVRAMVESHPMEEIERAFQLAGEAGAKDLRYVKAVIENKGEKKLSSNLENLVLE